MLSLFATSQRRDYEEEKKERSRFENGIKSRSVPSGKMSNLKINCKTLL
jgi:hypothetical protein